MKIAVRCGGRATQAKLPLKGWQKNNAREHQWANKRCATGTEFHQRARNLVHGVPLKGETTLCGGQARHSARVNHLSGNNGNPFNHSTSEQRECCGNKTTKTLFSHLTPLSMNDDSPADYNKTMSVLFCEPRLECAAYIPRHPTHLHTYVRVPGTHHVRNSRLRYRGQATGDPADNPSPRNPRQGRGAGHHDVGDHGAEQAPDHHGFAAHDVGHVARDYAA